MIPLAQVRTTCRVCPDAQRLFPVFSLGDICVSNFLDPHDLDPPTAPLALGLCRRCSLVQLQNTVPFDFLFRHYWYRSGVNETMVAELRDVVDAALRRVPVFPRDVVLDIGANDGTLLEGYHIYPIHPPVRPHRLAFEPARNLIGPCMAHAESGWDDAFPPEPKHAIWSNYGQIKIITAIAMAYDLEDPNAFVHGLKTLLHPDGVCILQFQDLASMLTGNAFDNICHEHLEYYTLHSLQRLLAHNDLVVYEVEPRAINGGSLRCYIGHKRPVPPWVTTRQLRPSVLDQLDREEAAGLIEPLDIEHAFKKFAVRVEEIRQQVRTIVEATRDISTSDPALYGGKCDAYGASTKGNTLLQYICLDHRLIGRIVERSPEKVGKVTAGTRIPIISEAEWRDAPAGVTLVPIWQFKEGILVRERRYLEQGGTLVFPLPYVVGHTNAEMLKELAR